MHGHPSSVHQISVHGSGRYAISTSQDTSILWDLDTFTRKRTLNGAQAVGIQEVIDRILYIYVNLGKFLIWYLLA